MRTRALLLATAALCGALWAVATTHVPPAHASPAYCQVKFHVEGNQATAILTSCKGSYEFVSTTVPNTAHHPYSEADGPPWTVALPPCRWQIDFIKPHVKILHALRGGMSCPPVVPPPTVPVTTTTPNSPKAASSPRPEVPVGPGASGGKGTPMIPVAAPAPIVPIPQHTTG